MSAFKGWTAEAALDVKTKRHEKAAKAKAETANAITRNIIRAVNMQPNCVAYRVNNTGIWDEAKQVFRKAHTEKGLPDIVGSVKGRSLWVEVKAGRDKMSREQLMRKHEIERAGGLYFEARSTDGFLKWFIEILKQ